jgi:hypothetical protein
MPVEVVLRSAFAIEGVELNGEERNADRSTGRLFRLCWGEWIAQEDNADA